MLMVYVAGSSLERDRARGCIALVRSVRGMSIQLDWVADMDRATQHEVLLPLEIQERIATRCLRAACTADVVWFLSPTQPSRGAWAELGAALMSLSSPYIVVSGEHTSAFLAHPNIDQRFATDAEAFDHIRRLA